MGFGRDGEGSAGCCPHSVRAVPPGLCPRTVQKPEDKYLWEPAIESIKKQSKKVDNQRAGGNQQFLHRSASEQPRLTGHSFPGLPVQLYSILTWIYKSGHHGHDADEAAVAERGCVGPRSHNWWAMVPDVNLASDRSPEDFRI